MKLGSRNWEANIHYVSIKRCSLEEDPLGYKALFHSDVSAGHKADQSASSIDNQAGQQAFHEDIFEVGASFLSQRELNLQRAGFEAPMTSKAIDLVQQQLGTNIRVEKKQIA